MGSAGLGDEGEDAGYAGFLPPRPSGPEPDLESPPPGAPQPTATPGSPQVGYAPPAEHEAHAPDYAPPQQQLGWGPPTQAGPPQPWTYAQSQPVPDNGAAVAGLSLSITAGALLLVSVGTSTIISIACAVLGIHYSRKGRERVDRGETPKHRGVAQAGYVTGIVTLGLSILCTVLWTLVVVLYTSNDEFRQDLKDELEDRDGDSPGGFETSVQVGALVLRMLAMLVR